MTLAVLLLIPQGISVQTQPIVTGHSTFLNGDVYDQCLASVAGILRSRVMWFNDQVLVERYPGKGNYVYVTEHGGDDPTKKLHLFSEGVSYTFVDPNGAAWHVEELFIAKDQRANVDVGIPDTQEPNMEEWEIETDARAGIAQGRQYVWVVEVAPTPILDQFPGDDPHSIYNFLALVDTCKFNNNTMTRAPQVDHDDPSVLNDHYGHPNGDSNHTHESWNADIYVGQKPRVVPGGVSTDGAEYQSQWVTSDAGRSNAMQAPNRADNLDE